MTQQDRRPGCRRDKRRSKGVVQAILAELERLGASDVLVDFTHAHPQVTWLFGTKRGRVTVPKTASDPRSLQNNVSMVRRMVRQQAEA